MLCDLGLPGLSGFEVASRLREQPECRGTLLVALSGYGRDDDRRQSQLAGFDHHLTKPVDPEVLAALIEQRRLV
ncbi:MAG: response regulator [Ramlibacter sp.]|nr:response regulator [Ramlibacter sp.]